MPARLLVLALIVAHAPIAFAADAAKPLAGSAPKVRRVIVVFKTHFDIGYTELARDVVERYRTTMIEKALDVCEAARKLPPEQRFVWTLPGWPMQKILVPPRPETASRLERAIGDGQLVWHALPGSTHTESLELEDLVRGLRFSTNLSLRFGKPLARDAKMTDVPSHVWVLPTLLKNASVSFLHIGCNSCSASPDLPRLFWWEGPDGSRLLTYYEATGYGSELKPPEDWPYQTWLALIHSGDNAGPPKPEQVRKLLEQAARELPGVEVRMGRLSDFADAVLAEKALIPVVRADMPDTWIHGIMSMPQETKLARNLRPQIVALEWLSAMLAGRGVKVTPAASVVEAAYEQSFLYGEHTWGASSRYYSPRLYCKEWSKVRALGKYSYAEESWREHGAYAHELQNRLQPALAADLKALSMAIRVTGPRIVVFNPLPWQRSGVARLAVPAGTARLWKDAATGRPAAAAEHDGLLDLLVEALPPLGYRTYVPGAEAAPGADLHVDEAKNTIENEYFRAVLDLRRGTIASLVEKHSRRELVDSKAPYGFGQYLYERFNDDDHKAYLNAYCKHQEGWTHQFGHVGLPPASRCKHCHASPKDFHLSVRRDDVQVSALLHSPASKLPKHAVSLRVTLARGCPCLDLEWSVDKKRAEPQAESGWLVLPFAQKEPAFRLGRLGSVIDPAKDIRPGANHEVFCLNSGMTVADAAGRGAGLCPIDSPLVSLGQEGLFRYTRQFTPRKPTVMVNLFNNTWGTNFQQWIEGSWTSRVRIWATEGRGCDQDLIGPAWEARSRCLAAFSDGPAGNLPLEDRGLGLSRRGVLVTAVAPTAGGLVLRLWEQSGQGGPVDVRLPEWLAAKRAQPCDLRNTPQGKPLEVRDRRLELPVPAWAPASVILTNY